MITERPKGVDVCDKAKRRQTLGRYLDGKSSAWTKLAFGRAEGQVYPPGMEELYLEIQRLTGPIHGHDRSQNSRA
jgi:hypothetical protein